MSASMNDPRRGAGAGESNGSGPAQVLAAVVNTSAADDSYAITCSILEDSQMVGTLEAERLRYILLWPFMMLVAIWCFLLSIAYRIVVRPAEKERQVLGPERLTWWFDKLHPVAHTVRNGVTTSQALDAVYAIRRIIPQPVGLRERLTRFWLDQPDAAAVRNRLRITYTCACDALERLVVSGKQEPIRFLVLACGSAQASIEAVAAIVAKYPEARSSIRLTLVDVSESSLRRAFRLAEARGVAELVTIVPVNLWKFVHRQPEGSWDIVEMVGFLDYLERDRFVAACAKVKRVLAPEGVFITAAICPSPWSFVVRWVTNWPSLIRRSPKAIDGMLQEAGFGTRIAHLEPHRIHAVFLCGK